MKVGDLGIDGEGFWLQSPLIKFRDNVAAGNHGAGIMFYGVGLSRPKEMGGLVESVKIYLKKFGITVSPKIARKWNASVTTSRTT